jgi:adenylate kinase family enzyme
VETLRGDALFMMERKDGLVANASQAEGMPPRRVVVVGVSGVGKTTFAQQLGERLGAPAIEMDALHWGPNWTMAELDVFRERVRQALAGERWVVDGNYSKVRDIVWTQADTLVWLDLPLPLILWRLMKRSVRRVVSREELWNGNRETFQGQFLSRDSLFLWALKTHAQMRKTYPQLVRQPEYSHLRVWRLRSPREVARWLAAMEPRRVP